MKAYPEIPRVEEAPPALFERGHLWIYEHVLGLPFRFQLTDDGTLRFGDRNRSYAPDAVPDALGHAARHVREELDRAGLRKAVADVEAITFIGRATVDRGVAYDWGRLPSVLGTDIWHGDRERFLEPGSVENSYRQLGLTPINTVDREVNVRDFDPDSYGFPASAWYDGPVAGLVIENKGGARARRLNPAVEPADGTDRKRQTETDLPADAADLAERLATKDRLSRVVTAIEDRGKPVRFDAVHERLFEAILREEYRLLFDGPHTVDADALRSSLADVVGQFLAER